MATLNAFRALPYAAAVLACGLGIGPLAAQNKALPALQAAGNEEDSPEEPAFADPTVPNVGDPQELPPATKPLVNPMRRPAPAVRNNWSGTSQRANQQPAQQNAQAQRSLAQSRPSPARSGPQAKPAERQFDPNAKPMTNGGRPLVLKAYELTRTAKQEADFTKIIELCRTGMEQGVDGKTAGYGRRLSAWAHNGRGEVRADAGQTKDAFDDFDTAVGLDGKQGRAIHNRGVCYAMLGNHAAAIADFSKAIELSPNFANAWFNRGEMYYEKRDFVSAIRDYNQALKLAPKDAAALNSRGHALFRQRRYADALTDYNRALEIDPSSAAAYVNRGDLLAEQGKFSDAAKDYRAAIKANPQLGRAYQSAAWLMATCPDDKFRNADLAIEAAQKAIELDGDSDYRYLETLAAAQANSGEYEDAVKTQERAIEVAPEAVALVYKGRVEKYRAGRPHREPAAKFAIGSQPAARR